MKRGKQTCHESQKQNGVNHVISAILYRCIGVMILIRNIYAYINQCHEVIAWWLIVYSYTCD